MIYEDAQAFAASEAYAARNYGRERPLGVLLDGEVVARAEHGRWLADCPCGGARLVQPGVAFWCADCGHGPVPVRWPDDREAIDAVLMARPIGNRHWFPNETLDDLRNENRAHDLAVG